MTSSRLIRYLAGRSLTGAATQMQGVVLSWIVYERTSSALHLGLIGLAWFLPSAILVVPTGSASDHFDRRVVVCAALAAQASGALALFFCTAAPIAVVYGLVLAIGAGRAFSSPAFQSLLPEVVDMEDFPAAVAASSTTNQIATIAGPALGGLLYARIGSSIFLTIAGLQVAALAALVGLPLVRLQAHSPKQQGGSESGRAWPMCGRTVCCWGPLAWICSPSCLAG